MPYPHEHAVRLNDPKKYVAYNRVNDKFGPGIDVIYGRTSSGDLEIQAVRFSADKYTIEEVRKHVKDKGWNPISIEAATVKKDSADIIDTIRYDRSCMTVVKRSDSGYLEATAPITRSGIFVYKNPDGTPRREFRDPMAVFNEDSMATAKMIPVTNDHPACALLDSSNTREYSVGHTGETIIRDGSFLVANLVVNDASAIAAIESGKKEISMGYRCDLIPENGTWEGQPYDFRQENIRYNHLAIVKRGRAGADVALNLDSADINDDLTTSHERTPNMATMKKVNLDGVEHEVPEAVAGALEKATETAATATAEATKSAEQVTAVTADLESARATVDSLTADLNALKSRDVKAEVQAAVKARLGLERTASKILGDVNLDSLDDKAIMVDTIKKVRPTINLDGKDDTYILAAFDLAVQAHQDGINASADAGQRQAAGHTAVNKDAADNTPEAATARLIADSLKPWANK